MGVSPQSPALPEHTDTGLLILPYLSTQTPVTWPADTVLIRASNAHKKTSLANGDTVNYIELPVAQDVTCTLLLSVLMWHTCFPAQAVSIDTAPDLALT